MNSSSNKYDHLFYNVIPNAIGGVKIFGYSDNYYKPQKYDEVTNLENRLWTELYQRLELILNQYTSKEYLIGLMALPIPRDRFPKFESISPIIFNSTGWSLYPVSGFLEEKLFFDLNNQRNFPVTDIIRKSPRFTDKYLGVDIKNNDGYTPEPDIFHDVQAHVPFLMNKEYADFMWEVGSLGYKILKNEKSLELDLVEHNLKRLQNFAWWTYEFGLVRNKGESDIFRREKNNIDYEIYGAGIISSYDETCNVINCAKGKSRASKFLKYDINEMVLTCFDYSNIQDRYYVADSMEEVYDSFRQNQDLFNFVG